MKRMFMVLAILFCFIGVAIAEDSGITLKQSVFFTWNDGERKNATTATILKTDATKEPISKLPDWAKATLDGWSFDAGAAYEDEVIKDACLLMGREFGTLGKYVPWLIFPFKDRIEISVYATGLYFPDIVHHLRPQGCSGIGYIKGTLKF